MAKTYLLESLTCFGILVLIFAALKVAEILNLH